MIITERIESLRLIRRYSDKGMFIKRIQTGEVFPSAVDPIDSKYTYKETNNPIDSEHPSPQEILDILLGNQEME